MGRLHGSVLRSGQRARRLRRWGTSTVPPVESRKLTNVSTAMSKKHPWVNVLTGEEYDTWEEMIAHAKAGAKDGSIVTIHRYDCPAISDPDTCNCEAITVEVGKKAKA